MIPSNAPTAAERWREILRLAAITTIRTAPYIWALVMLPPLFDGQWNLKAVAVMTPLTLPGLALVFVIVVAVQLLPESWHR